MAAGGGGKGQPVPRASVAWPVSGEVYPLKTPDGPRFYRVRRSNHVRTTLEPLKGAELHIALAETAHELAQQAAAVACLRLAIAISGAAEMYVTLSVPARLLYRMQGNL